METVEEILTKLKKAGLKFTDKRQQTVEFFVNNHDKYLSAKEVYDHVKQTFPNVSFDTIYRTLSTLLEQNIIERLEFSDDAEKYRLKCHEAHHHHLVCIGCGSTFPLNQCPMDNLLNKIDTFKIQNHRFEVYGYCLNCQSSLDHGNDHGE